MSKSAAKVILAVDEDERALAAEFLKAKKKLPKKQGIELKQGKKETLSMTEYQEKSQALSLEVKRVATIDKFRQISGDVFMWGSNAQFQLGRPGAERKLKPFPLKMAKSKRIIYLHADLTSTFCLAADKRMYFWGTTPMNPNQHVYAAGGVKEVPPITSGLSLGQLEELRKQREVELAMEARRKAEHAEAGKFVSPLPESIEIAAEKRLSDEMLELLPHEFIWTDDSIVWISSGIDHVVGVTAKGRVFTYGSGSNGRLGLGGSNNSVSPKYIPLDGSNEKLKNDKVIQCHCGVDFTLLLTMKGRVYSFGCGEHYQLGHGNMSDASRAYRIESLANRAIISVATGSHHCLALSSTGELLSWGMNSCGQCGLAHLELGSRPTTLEYSRETARKSNKEMCDQREKARQVKAKKLAKAKKAAQSRKDESDEDPYAHQALEGDTQSSDSDSFSSDDYDAWMAKQERIDAMLKKKGSKRTADQIKEMERQEKDIKKKWEDKQKRMEKLKEQEEKDAQIEDIKKKEKVIKKRAKAELKLKMKKEQREEKKLRSTGNVAKLQRRKERELPDSHDVFLGGLLHSKDMMPALLNVVDVQCGSVFSAAITEDGKLFMWGDNSEGQLGVGSTIKQKVPTLVKALSGKVVVQVRCGRKHTIALTATGSVFAWGANSDGQLGLGHRQPVWIPTEILHLKGRQIALISAGLDHCLCLEGQLRLEKAETRKFLTRAEMEKEVKLRQKQERSNIKHKRKTGQSAIELVRLKADHQKSLITESRQATKELKPHKGDAAEGYMRHKSVIIPQKKVGKLVKEEKQDEKDGKLVRAGGVSMVAVATITMAAAALGGN